MLLAAALSPMHAYCEGWSFDDARPEWGKFALGVVSGVAGHELGHYLVATAKGYKVRNAGELKVPPGNFGAGVVCAHLGITLAYVVYLKDQKQGDVVGMAHATGRSNNQIALALAVPGALDAWRLFGEQVPEWVPNLSMLYKGLGIAWAWTY